MAKKKVTKLFILDTNVLIHDPSCLFRFQEHDICIPMVTLEELDHHKKGNTDIARSARQASRYLDQIVEGKGDMEHGFPLSIKDGDTRLGRLFLSGIESTEVFSPGYETKADNRILSTVKQLQVTYSTHRVVLVSKDINIRIKARALNIPTEDYHSDKVIDDTDLLFTGYSVARQDIWDFINESWKKDDRTFYRVSASAEEKWLPGQYLVLPDGGHDQYAMVTESTSKGYVIRSVRRYDHAKNSVWGISALNFQQVFALDALMDPSIPFVSLVGQAGSGKTLMALAAGLTLTLEAKTYHEIIVTRATIPIGEDIGFLPGTEEEKMAPWMGAIDDNLDVLHENGDEKTDWGRAATRDLIRSRIKIKSMSFMRGRTFLNKFVIIDETQNLTPKQMKTLITRSGPGTKIVCLGNLAQIDTPYLTEGSSGLTYVVDRFKGHFGLSHVILEKSERSWLAEKAATLL